MKYFKELEQPQVFHVTIGPKATTQNMLFHPFTKKWRFIVKPEKGKNQIVNLCNTEGTA
jgi:hypothetical protein